MKLMSIIKQVGWYNNRNDDSIDSSQIENEIKLIEPFVDRDFYLRSNEDVASANIDPVRHYHLYGWQEGRDPSPVFKTREYLEANPELTAKKINPLLHYAQNHTDALDTKKSSAQNKSVQRDRHHPNEQADILRPHFDAEFYLSQNHDVASTDIDPLVHYITYGWREGRDPTPHFSTNYYIRTHLDIARSGINPFWHYLIQGRLENRAIAPAAQDVASVKTEDIIVEPVQLLTATSIGSIDDIRPHFDSDFYLAQNPDVRVSGADPVEHYWYEGWKENRDPTPEFSTEYYIEVHQDVARTGLNPFWHYVVQGRLEERATFPATQIAPNNTTSNAIDTLMLPPMKLTPIGSMEDIRSSFDAEFYLARNPDVRESGVDPLEHYWYEGWKEGRDPNLEFSTHYYTETNPDLADQVDLINPFWHYVMAGRSEGRNPRHPGGYKVERLRHTGTLEASANDWLQKNDPSSLISSYDVVSLIGAHGNNYNNQLIISVGHDNYLLNAGGVQLCIHHEEQVAVERGAAYLNIHPWQPLPRLGHISEEPDPIMVLLLNGTEIGKIRISELILAVKEVRPHLAQIRVVIHHLLGHLPERIIETIRATGTNECWIWLHDFFTLCPSFTLQRNSVSYCGAPPLESNSCSLCRFGFERKTHLSRMERFFDAVDVHVISPSKVALELWKKRGGARLKPVSETVLPHIKLKRIVREKQFSPEQSPAITVGFVGTPASHKGWDLFEAVVLKFRGNSSYRFIYFGREVMPLPGAVHVPVHVTADNPDAMSNAVSASNCDLILHWATWPETFSLSTYEAYIGGSWVLTNEVSGNVKATVIADKRGEILKDEADLHLFFLDGRAEKMATLVRAERAREFVEHTMSNMTHDIWVDEDNSTKRPVVE